MQTIGQSTGKAIFADRSCPQCGTSTLKGGGVRAPEPAETLPFEKLSPYWHGFFKDKMFFTYRRCADCSQLYSPAYFRGKQLEALYAEMAANMDVVDESALKRTAREYLGVLRNHASLRGVFLEIGPDVGAFAHECAAAGTFDEFLLFEPNTVVHDALRAAVGKPSQRIDHYFERGSVADGTVDVAAMVHVLDHVLDPVGLARDVLRTLKSSGCLMLVTHDERSLLARILRGRWPAYCLQHPHLFNRKSMVQTLKRAGFSRVVTVPSTNYFPVTFLIAQIALALRVPLPSLPELPWFRVGLKLGNFITIAYP